MQLARTLRLSASAASLAVLGTLRIGQPVEALCDGCAAAIPAQISFVSNSPEYTSPLIYSKENRAALVFMIEARPAPAQAQSLHPGQPVEVYAVREAR